jgi:hypothetical protein
MLFAEGSTGVLGRAGPNIAKKGVVMVSTTALTAEVTNVMRDFGTGVEARGRALGASMLDLAVSVGVSEATRARIVDEIQVPSSEIHSWIATALSTVGSLLGTDAREPERDPAHTTRGFIIVDRELTRC